LSAINHFIKKGVRQAEVDEYLSKELSRAGYGGVEITKTPLGERIIIHASKPGVVIGRRGKTIRTLTNDLVVKYGFDDPKIDVKEVENPELNSKVMAYSLVSAIERGVHRRRAAYSVLRRVMNAGAKGCEIIIAGKLTSKRSRHEAYRMGLVAKSGEIGTKHVQSANAIAVMKLGTVGITVNIMRGDLALPDEISVLSVNLDKEAEETAVSVEEEKKEVTPEKAKIAEKAPKEKVKKEEKKPKDAKIEPIAKKTDLDVKVEELSDLIEKTPSKDKKPKAKPKPVKKVTPAVEKAPVKKKPTTKKAPKEEKPVKKTTKPKAKTPKKEEPKTTTKKAAPKKKATPTKKADTTKTTTKKKEPKKETGSKGKTTAAKKDTKSKTTKSKKEAKKK
jgi:small subunit ribosomal protein S3